MSRKPVPVVSSSKGGAFNPSKFVRPGLNEDEIVEIKEAFDLFDTDGGGEIDPKGKRCII
jgi:Ca2+-binding EF-hand superfamily protein